ncbi:hypothetical protein PENTCL1PPCAC_12764, partial [Pristionchus entomophagus]
SRIFRVGFVSDNFPFLFPSLVGKQRGILNDIYDSLSKLNGFTLEWVHVEEYGSLKPDGSYTGLLGDISKGVVDASVERSYQENRIRNFSPTTPVIYQSDAYITRTDLVSRLSVANLLVFSPFMLFLLILAFTIAFVVEEVTHVFCHRMRYPTTQSFLSQLAVKNNPFVNVKLHSFILYRVVFSSILAGAALRVIYNSAFTGGTVISASHERNILDMVYDIRINRSRIIIEDSSYISAEKTEAIFGSSKGFPSNYIIPDEELFLEHLCENINDYGKVNSFFLATVNPQNKIRLPCDITTVASGNWQDSQLSIIRSSVTQAAPYTLLLRKGERRRKSLNSIILGVYDFEKISTFQWRRYTNRNLFIPKPKALHPLYIFNVIKLSDMTFLFYFLFVGYSVGFIMLSVEIGLMFANFLIITKSLRLAKLS